MIDISDDPHCHTSFYAALGLKSKALRDFPKNFIWVHQLRATEIYLYCLYKMSEKNGYPDARIEPVN